MYINSVNHHVGTSCGPIDLYVDARQSPCWSLIVAALTVLVVEFLVVEFLVIYWIARQTGRHRQGDDRQRDDGHRWDSETNPALII